MGFATRLYRFMRYVLRFMAYVQLISQPAFRLAQNPTEKATVVRFVFKLVLYRGAAVISRHFQQALAHEDTPLTLKGVKYCVGINSHETTVFGEIYQQRDYEKVIDFVPKAGWVVVDVGANIGIFAVQQALRGARVYAFEPNRDCYRRLTWSVNANELDNRISPLNLAIGAESGSGTLLVEHGFTLGGMIVPQEATSSQSTIAITSLDEIVPTFDIMQIDLLKIDTEGAEVEVLRGAKRTIGIVERVIMEYHSHELSGQIKMLLRDQGFVIVRQDDHDLVAGRGVLYACKGTTA